MEVSRKLDNSQSSEILYFLDGLIEIVNVEDKFTFDLMCDEEVYNAPIHYTDKAQALRAAKFQALKSVLVASSYWVVSCIWHSDRIILQSDESLQFFGDCRLQENKRYFETPIVRQELRRNLKWRPSGIETKIRLINESGEFIEGKDTLQLIDLGLDTFVTLETLIPTDFAAS